MAVASLGRLTLDLAVRLSDFTDGMSRAERETAERTQNMQESVTSFREHLASELGGTQLGGIIDGLNARFDSVNGSILAMSGALAGMAVGGVVVALGSLAQMAMETAKADAEMAVLANRANTSVQNFQALTVAAQGLGISQDQLGSILADTQEILGEFSATAGGGAADFFEALQNNTKMSDEAIREFGKTLQGKDGVEAIQLIKDKLDELGASAQEQRFVLESLGSDLGNLSIIFDNGGAILGQYRDALEEAGVIKSKEAIEQSQLLAAQMQSTHQRFEGFKSQLAGQMIPILGTLGQHFLSSGKQGSNFGGIIQGVGTIAKGVAISIVTVGAVVAQFGDTIGQVMAQLVNIGSTAYDFMMADGLLEKIGVLNRSVGNFQGMAKSYADNTTNRIKGTINTINNIYTGAASATDVLTSANLSLMRAENERTKGLRLNTAEAEANAKANEKAAKANEKAAKSAKSAAKDNAKLPTATANAIMWGANKLGIDPNYLASVISFETAGTFSTNARHPKSSATGLIQFMEDADGKVDGKYYGMTRNQFGALSAMEQMQYVVKFFQGKKLKPGANLGQVYDAVTGTGYRNIPKYNKKGERVDAYWLNRVWDANKDGYIAPGESVKSGAFKAHIKNFFKDGINAIAVGEVDSQLAKSELKSEQEAKRQTEELERNKQTIAQRYATENERNLIQHQENLKSINETYAQGSVEWKQYTDKEKQRYQDMIAENELDRKLRYAEGEEKLELEYQKKIQQIKKDFAEDDPARETMLKKAKEAYQKDLANFKWVANEKVRAQQEMIEHLKFEMSASSYNSVHDMIDVINKSTLNPEEYQYWKIEDNFELASSEADFNYEKRKDEINQRDDKTGDYLFDEVQRYELLEQAYQEHTEKMALIMATYNAEIETLDKQAAETRAQTAMSAFSAQTDAMKNYFGEQSRIYRFAAAMERGYAVYQAVMNIEKTRSSVYAAIAAIPLVGPYLAGPMSIAAAAIQVANAAKIKGMQVPSFSGVAHGGMDYIPKETTFLLDKGERVLSPRQNRDLTKYLNDRQNTNNSNNVTVNVNNNSSADVSASRQADGTVTIDVVDKMIKQSFGRIGQPNSFESRQITRHTTARFNRQ